MSTRKYELGSAGNSERGSINEGLRRAAKEAKRLSRIKRRAQHQQWLRVMMEGQATPDRTYQKS